MLDHHGVLDPNPIVDTAYEHNAVSGPLMDHGQVSSAMSSGTLSSEWYPPGTLPSSETSYENAYLTPYSSSGTEPYPPSTFVKPLDLPPMPIFSTYDGQIPPRPRSSPSTFGPNGGDIVWPGNPLGIKHVNNEDFSASPGYSNGAALPVRSQSPYFGNFGVSEISAPQPRKSYPPIAPNPMGVFEKSSSIKRSRTEEASPEAPPKRRKSSCSMTTPELGEEDQLLMRLKEEENLPWKDIAARFQSDLGKSYQVPALQMRFKRLRERIRPWTDVDINALRMAHEYWEKNKFEIISAKMTEYGAAEKWPAKLCARKWSDINPTYDSYMTHSGTTPAFSQMSTPIEGPGGYVPPFLHHMQ
ncbi:MAG: hypothetical protein M1822_006819 [Bathelium mastoideum]|nr:MAG: hypothetical protein M1822_006819 [Bathelium mastoideum]